MSSFLLSISDLQSGSYFSVRSDNESGSYCTQKMPDSYLDTFINYREEGTNSSAAPVSQYWGRGFDSHHFDCASVCRSVIWRHGLHVWSIISRLNHCTYVHKYNQTIKPWILKCISVCQKYEFYHPKSINGCNSREKKRKLDL